MPEISDMTHMKNICRPKEYYEEHGEIIVNLMRQDRILHASTLVRTRYSYEWICRNQLMPLIEGDGAGIR